MPCADSCTCPEHAAERFRVACERIRADISGRRLMCQRIYERARRFHLDVTVEQIDRHYEWFLRWYNGGIATGYLMNRTGVRSTRGTRR
jgi:hypothetical protein